LSQKQRRVRQRLPLLQQRPQQSTYDKPFPLEMVHVPPQRRQKPFQMHMILPVPMRLVLQMHLLIPIILIIVIARLAIIPIIPVVPVALVALTTSLQQKRHRLIPLQQIHLPLMREMIITANNMTWQATIHNKIISISP